MNYTVKGKNSERDNATKKSASLIQQVWRMAILYGCQGCDVVTYSCTKTISILRGNHTVTQFVWK